MENCVGAVFSGEKTCPDSAQQKALIQEYLMIYGWASGKEIAQALEISVRRVNRLLMELEMDNFIIRRGSLRKSIWNCPPFAGCKLYSVK